jgi:hypothetical protein
VLDVIYDNRKLHSTLIIGIMSYACPCEMECVLRSSFFSSVSRMGVDGVSSESGAIINNILDMGDNSDVLCS